MKTLNYLEAHFSEMLFSSFLLGLLLPHIPGSKETLISVIMAALILLACSKIEGSFFRQVEYRVLFKYYVIRFLVLPIVVLGTTLLFDWRCGAGIFILTAVPAGMASAAITGLCQGNVSLALQVTIISSLLCPISIPGILMLFGADGSLAISISDMAITLTTIIVAPILFDRLLNSYALKMRGYISRASGGISVILLFVLLLLLVNSQKEAFLELNYRSSLDILVSSGLFCLYYFTGWALMRGQSKPNRITGSICSGANNNALAISLGYLYFPSQVVFLLLSEVGWTVGVACFKKWIATTSKN